MIILTLLVSMAFAQSPGKRFSCEELKVEIQSLLPAGAEFGAEDKTLPAGKLEPAIRSLEKFPSPTQDEVNSALAKLNQNFESFVPDYLSMLGAGCRPLRLDLSRWIMNTALAKGVSAVDKKAAREVLKEMVLKPQYPTLLNAATNLSVIKAGLEKKLWSLKSKTQFKKMRADFNAERLEKQKGWSEVEDLDIRNVNQKPPEEHAKMLQANPKVKKLMLEEAEFSKKALERVSELARQL